MGRFGCRGDRDSEFPAKVMSKVLPAIPSLSEASSTDATSTGASNINSESSGYRSSPVLMFSTGGSRLDGTTSASAGGVPWWGVALGGVAMVAGYLYVKRKA
jgi:hypothetical protein